MNLLLLEPGERLLDRADPRAVHLLKVLRARAGTSVRAGETDGPLGVVTVLRCDEDGILVDFDPLRSPEPAPPVEVLLGHPRPIVLRRLLRDLATIGVARVAVCPTDLGERSYYRSNVWDEVPGLLREGVAQGGTTRLPRVERFATAALAARTLRAPAPSRLLLHAGGRLQLLDALDELPGGPIALAVGSERGWTPAEIDALLAEGFTAVDAGPRTLRTETAAVVAAWAAVSRCTEAWR